MKSQKNTKQMRNKLETQKTKEMKNRPTTRRRIQKKNDSKDDQLFEK